MEESCYPWGLKGSPQTHHLDQPQDSATGSHRAWGASHCHDPMLGGLGGSMSSSLDGQSLPLDERIDFNILQQVNSLLEDRFPNFPYFPDDLEVPNSATQDSDMPPSTTHQQCHREGSSAINVLDETVVAGVNGMVPLLDDLMPICADVKPFIGTSGIISASAKGENQAYIGTSGETGGTKAHQPFTGTLGVPTCTTEDQFYGVPASAKSGSQAIDYIRTDAVLETNGIPAFSPLALSVHIPGTDLAPPDQDTSTKRTVPGLNTSDPPSAGTIGSNGVPREDLDSTQDKPAILEVNQLGTIPDTIPDTKIVPQLTGTQHTKLGTFIDPQKVEIIMTLSTVSIDPNKLVPEVSPGTVTYSPEPLGTLGNGTAYGTNSGDTVDEEQDNGMKNAKKRIRKRKKAQGEECQQKVPKYKQGPQNDVIEERKRQDAMRAKRGRDRNRQKMEELQEANSRLEEEVEGRRRWETALLAVLRKHGIVVAPYGTGGISGHQMSPAPPVTSPALPVTSPALPVTSPAQLPMMSPATPNR